MKKAQPIKNKTSGSGEVKIDNTLSVKGTVSIKKTGAVLDKGPTSTEKSSKNVNLQIKNGKTEGSVKTTEKSLVAAVGINPSAANKKGGEQLGIGNNIEIPSNKTVIPTKSFPLEYFKNKVSFNSFQNVFKFFDVISLLSLRFVNRGMNSFVLKYIEVSENERIVLIKELDGLIKTDSLNYEAQLTKAEKKLLQIKPADLMMLKSMKILPDGIVTVLNIIAYFFNSAKIKEFGSYKNAISNQHFHKTILTDPNFLNTVTKFNRETFVLEFDEFDKALSVVDSSKVKATSMTVNELFEYMRDVKVIFLNSKLLRLAKWSKSLNDLDRFHKKLSE